jgi:hypothetical protein
MLTVYEMCDLPAVQQKAEAGMLSLEELVLVYWDAQLDLSDLWKQEERGQYLAQCATITR